MKKILLFSMMVLLLGACSSTTESDNMNKVSRLNTENHWWEQAGQINSEYWWIVPDYEEDANDSDDSDDSN